MSIDIQDRFEDELPFSLIARYIDSLNSSRQKALLLQLFGSENAIPAIEFPSHLEYFTSQISDPEMDSDVVIDEMTFFPLFAPFLDEAKYHQLRNDMKGDRGSDIYMRVGLAASDVKPPLKLRYCPLCIYEDRRIFGKCYWHRIHQVSGVFICPKHYIWLEDSPFLFHNRDKRLLYISAEKITRVSPMRPVQNDIECFVFIRVAQEILYLFTKRHYPIGQEELSRRYLFLLFQKGYCNYAGRFSNFATFYKDFEQFIGADFLSRIGLHLGNKPESSWLYRILRAKKTTHHPIKHILLILFLRLSVEEFLNMDIPAPFGHHTWPCLNPVCTNYRKNTIQSIEIRKSAYTNGLPIGIFHCECGFVYQRTGPDQSETDKFKIGKMINYGELWEQALQNLLADSSLSLREIAKRLGADSNTIIKYAKKRGFWPRFMNGIGEIPELDPRKKPGGFLDPKTEKAPLYREKWLKCVISNPKDGVKNLRNIEAGTYTWLYRNDRDWLIENSPPKVKIPIKKRVDWKGRDTKLSYQIKEAAGKILSRPGKPVQVSISSIGRELNCLSLLQKFIHMLPLTQAAFSDWAETQDKFGIRRIDWAIEQYRKESIIPKRWQIIRRAGVSRLLVNEEVIKYLDGIEAKLNDLDRDRNHE